MCLLISRFGHVCSLFFNMHVENRKSFVFSSIHPPGAHTSEPEAGIERVKQEGTVEAPSPWSTGNRRPDNDLDQVETSGGSKGPLLLLASTAAAFPATTPTLCGRGASPWPMKKTAVEDMPRILNPNDRLPVTSARLTLLALKGGSAEGP